MLRGSTYEQTKLGGTAENKLSSLMDEGFFNFKVSEDFNYA
ncbi:MAG: hypothetical protein WA118_06825 [Carboxydocellales bacterium]